MLKTLKRKIALVAVAGLGFGLVSTVPAFAGATVLANLELAQTDSSVVLTTTDTAAAEAAEARAGVQTLQVTQEAAVDTTYDIYLSTTNVVADVADANTITLTAIADDAATTTAALHAAAGGSNAIATANKGARVTVTGAGASNITITTASLAAGTYYLIADGVTANNTGTGAFVFATIDVRAVGAPASVSWPAASLTQLSATAVDRGLKMVVKDASGVATFLVGSEKIAVDISPVTGVGTTQVGLSATGAEAAAIAYDALPVDETVTGYDVTINGNGDGAGVTGTTIPGTTYTLTAQMLRGTAAFGAPAALAYKRLSNTAALAGTVSFVDGTVTTTAVTSVSAANGQAASSFKIKALDSAGGILQGATVALSVSGITGAFTNNNQVTGTDGLTANGIVFTPSSAGTGTISATITTGTTSITASVPVTSSGYGALAATVAGTTAVNVNGTGWVAEGAGVYTGSLNITKIKTTITGLTPNTAVLLAATPPAGGTATSDIGLNPTTDSTGTAVATWTLTSVGAGENFVVTADGDGAGGTAAVTVVTVNFETAQAAISTTPVAGTSTYVAPGATVEVVATIENQFGASVPGGVVVFTNTVKPAAATAQTAATVNVGADGKAKFNAVLGSAVGTYTYTANAKTVDGADISVTAAEHTSTFSFIVNAAGAPSAITVTGGANTALTEFRVLVDADGSWNLTGGAAAAKSKALTTNLAADAAAYTTMTVSVGAAGVIVNAKPGDGVLINSASANPVIHSSFNGATDLAVASNASGVATFYVTTTKPGTNSVEFSVGSVKATAEFKGVLNNQLDDPAAAATARTVSLDKSTATVAGNIVQITATVKDIWGNAVPGVALTGAITGAAGRFSGGARTQAAVNTDANGQVVFEITSNGTETGTGTLTVAGTEAAAAANFLTGDLTANGAATIFTKTSTKSVTSALTVTAGSTVGAATETAINNVKSDVKAVSDTVATLSKAVTTIQSSVTELTSSFSAQIKSLSAAIAKISKAIAALSKKIK